MTGQFIETGPRQIAIRHIELLATQVRLPSPADNARAQWKERRSVLLRLWTEDGLVGQGEASPLPGYSSDDWQGCAGELLQLKATTLLLMAPAPCVWRELDRFFHQIPPLRNPAAVFALEMAVLDLLGQLSDRPAHRLMRPDGRTLRPIPLATLVKGVTPQAVIAHAHKAYARGIRVFKFKLGRPGQWQQEWRTLKHLAEALPLDAKLRIDVNGAWSLDEASRRLQALSAIGPELVEEPVAANHLGQLAPGLIPIALDESLQGPGWRQRLIAAAARGVCQAIVLKPMALGGIVRCLEMAALARSLGITVIVTHLFDGPLGLAAAAELALALGDDIGPCGLDRHCALYAWSPSSVPQVGPSALTAAPGAGLCLPALAFPKQGEMVRL